MGINSKLENGKPVQNGKDQTREADKDHVVYVGIPAELSRKFAI